MFTSISKDKFLADLLKGGYEEIRSEKMICCPNHSELYVFLAHTFNSLYIFYQKSQDIYDIKIFEVNVFDESPAQIIQNFIIDIVAEESAFNHIPKDDKYKILKYFELDKE